MLRNTLDVAQLLDSVARHLYRDSAGGRSVFVTTDEDVFRGSLAAGQDQAE